VAAAAGGTSAMSFRGPSASSAASTRTGESAAEQLREAVDAVLLAELPPGELDAVHELHEELVAGRSRARIEVVVRETMEVLALGE
jgi:hypothetical protein